jgi:hypothetical protein
MFIQKLNDISPLCTTQKILEHPELQIGREKTPLYIIATDWKTLDWESGAMACARFCALFFALPFFATKTCFYNGGAATVMLAASAVLVFRKDDGFEDQARQLIAIAAQHITITVYDLFNGFFVTASLLYLPVLPAFYAFAPEPVQQLHKYFVDKEEGLLTAKTKEFVIKILTKTEKKKTEEPPSTPVRQDPKKKLSFSDFSPASLQSFAKKFLQKYTSPSGNPISENSVS